MYMMYIDKVCNEVCNAPSQCNTPVRFWGFETPFPSINSPF